MTPDMVNRAQMFDSYFTTPVLVALVAGILVLAVAFVWDKIRK